MVQNIEEKLAQIYYSGSDAIITQVGFKYYALIAIQADSEIMEFVHMKPFIKYCGGKTYFLEPIRKILKGLKCEDYTYCEPMVGGGAVYFSESKRFKTAVISDVGGELMTCYRVIRDDIDGLIAELKSGKYKFQNKVKSKAVYNKIRSSTPKTDVEVAARTMYLLKTCFNGLMRKNKKGQFNTPPGSYKNPKICDKDMLKDVSVFLQGTKIICMDAIQTIYNMHGQTFLFVDPPYHDESDKEKFREFDGTFGDDDQEALIEAMIGSGHKFIYTNRNTNLVRKSLAGRAKIKKHALRHSIQPKYTFKIVEEEIIATNI